MANWNTLKTAVADVINANGNQAITGQLLQNVLNNIITNVGENATFAGIATLDTNPGAPDGPVFYLTATAGTYPNFNGIEVQDGEAVILLWDNNAWSKKVTGFATQEKLSQLGSKVDEKFLELNSNLSCSDVADDEESIVIKDNEGNDIAKIDKDSSNFHNLKSDGLDVAVVGQSYSKNESDERYLIAKDNESKLESIGYIQDESKDKSILLATDNDDILTSISGEIVEEDDESFELVLEDGEVVVKANKEGVTAKNLFVEGCSLSFKEIADFVKQQNGGIVGVLRARGSVNAKFTETIGDFDDIAKHFKLAVVKNGVLQYYLEQLNIDKIEGKDMQSCINGEDGDVLIVNDVPIYYAIYGNSELDANLFSLNPFEYSGIKSKKLEVRGVAPSYCVADGMGNIDIESRDDAATNIKAGYYKSNQDGDIGEMKGIEGKYRPYYNGDKIDYIYEQNGKLFPSKMGAPIAQMTQYACEKVCENKNNSSTVYTGLDLLTVEIMHALAESEFGTKCLYDMFGAAYTSAVESTESLFTDGKNGGCGVRLKKADGEWEYFRFNAETFVSGTIIAELFEVLNYWKSCWKVLEQHSVISYAMVNGILENTWFVYDGFEYKYTIPTIGKSVKDGVMSCTLYKKFRSKTKNLYINNTLYDGNDIEFVVTSALYRGYVLDISPMCWITGMNVVIYGDDINKHDFYITHDYRKYLTSKKYTSINKSESYDFERVYDFAGTIMFEQGYSRVRGIDHVDITTCVPKEYASSYNDKSGICLNVDKTSSTSPSRYVDSDKNNGLLSDVQKNVTGVKYGYGPVITNPVLNYIYLNHSRNYKATAGYFSMVCQNVIINN